MYKLRHTKTADYLFIYNLSKLVNKSRIIQTYGSWDENFQKEVFNKKFNIKNIKIITLDGLDIGSLEIETTKNNIHINEIQLLPKYQGRGIGTKILQDLIIHAKLNKIDLDLKVLKINPAKRLYERIGFIICKETNTHYFMNFITRP
ncbi:MAG: GNAT family N-acetyltransferase [Candidatus Woesearchaeota archaeon]|jgi:ribosomal protein S18 acetylase RimI-like enzyme